MSGIERNRRAAREYVDHSGPLIRAMMRQAKRKHAGQTHSDHCWARLAWGDGECECGGDTRALDTMTRAFLGVEP